MTDFISTVLLSSMQFQIDLRNQFCVSNVVDLPLQKDVLQMNIDAEHAFSGELLENYTTKGIDGVHLPIDCMLDPYNVSDRLAQTSPCLGFHNIW